MPQSVSKCMKGHCCVCRAWEVAFLPTFLTSMWNSTSPRALCMSLMMRPSLIPSLGAASWLGCWICQQKTCTGEFRRNSARLHLHLYHTPDMSALLTHGWSWQHCVLICVTELQWGLGSQRMEHSDSDFCSNAGKRAKSSASYVDHLDCHATLLQFDSCNHQADMNNSLFTALCTFVLHNLDHDIKGLAWEWLCTVCCFRQAKFESTQMQQQWVADFAKKWDAYDWTKQLGWSFCQPPKFLTSGRLARADLTVSTKCWQRTMFEL